MKSKKKMGYGEGSNRLLSCRLLCFGTTLAKVPQHHACHHLLYSSGSLNTHKEQNISSSFFLSFFLARKMETLFFWPMRLVFIFLNVLSWVLIFCSKLLVSSLVFQEEEEEVQQNVSVIICVLLYILSAHLLIYFFFVQVL
jgi:hypothetical protein